MEIKITHPEKEHGSRVYELIKETGGLDLNSKYYYYIMCDFYAKTSAIAFEGDKVVGYLSALVPPEEPNVLFAWQVAVHPDAQGKGVSKKLLNFAIDNNPELKVIKTTIGPDNMASQGLFKSVTKKHNASMSQEIYLSKEELGDHDPEIMFEFKPINQ